MKVNLKNILEGAKNSIFIKEAIEIVAKERLKECEACPWQSDNAKSSGYKPIRPDLHCRHCGCNLHWKTRVLSEQCPLDPPKWEAEVNVDEDKAIQEKLKEEK